jgi:hypothetical protein
MDKESEELKRINIWDRRLGSRDGCMVRKTEENVIQKINEKCSACIVCSEKMAMECRQASTR